MKQKDVALIIVTIFIGAVVSFIVSNMIFSTPANRQQQAEVVEAITPDFATPDSRYFNSKSIDPTQLIQIGNNNNSNPFNGNGQ
jgi:uncharacterized membrane protein YgaE (UPF0421/DUF939 family)